MVIHDREREAQWTEQRRTRERVRQATAKPRRPLSVVAVQSIACGVLLALVLLFRAVGGTAYGQLQQSFRKALERNELVAVWMRLWDGDVTETASLTEDDGVKLAGFTAETAQCSCFNYV